MTMFLAWVAIGMALAFAALVATIVIRRFFADRRRARELSMRPAIETLLGEYLAAEEPERPLSSPRAGCAGTRPHGRAGRDGGAERPRALSPPRTAGGLGDRRRNGGRPRLAPPPRTAGCRQALRQIGSAGPIRSLSVGLEDPDIDAGLICAAALAELADETLIPRVLALADSAALARPGAVAAILVTLGRRHPATIGDALRPEASIALRRLAAAVAGELRLSGHVPALREALAGEDDELQRAAPGASG